MTETVFALLAGIVAALMHLWGQRRGYKAGFIEGYQAAWDFATDDADPRDRRPRCIRTGPGLSSLPMGERPWNRGLNPLLWTPTPGRRQ